MWNPMKVSTRLIVLTMVALAGLLAIGSCGLYSLRQAMLYDKREQIINLLEMANHLATYFHQEEVAGNMTTEQAQAATKLALNQLNYTAKSFFWARRPNGLTLIHRDPTVIGKINMGRAPDGRPDGELYQEMLNRERTPVIMVQAKHPETGAVVQKMNGLIEFKPWGWWIGTGVFTDDIDTTFWNIGGILIGLIGLVTIGIGLISWQIIRRLTGTLGGEPIYAGEVMNRIAAGDLGFAIDLRQGDRTSLLAAVARMRQSLTEMIYKIRSSSDAVAVGSTQIAQGNIDLSSRTEEQAAALEQTAASMEQLTEAVKHNASNADQASSLATSTSNIVIEGSKLVAEVVHTMTGIQESSNKISEIIGIMEGIAFQTNILALNAAVEAARAGEQGRGFAVVASEVRNLSQRSSTAAKEIRDLIKTSADRVRGGTELVGRASEAMERVSREIGRVTHIMDEIVEASHEQSNELEQINDAITQMDNVTQQNAALVEQAAAAAGSLQGQVEQLRTAVAIFRT